MQKCIQSSENEYHDKSWKIKVYRPVSFQEGSNFENPISKCTLKFAQMITNVRSSFPERLSDTIC